MGKRSDLERRLAAIHAPQRHGSAIVAVLAVVSAIAIFSLALLTSGLDGARSVNHHVDDYDLSSAVESVGILAAENIWSGYLASNGGAAGDISSFRVYLENVAGVPDAGPGGPPSAEDGVDWLPKLSIPTYASGDPQFAHVQVDAVQVFRRDEGSSTQLFFTVSARTTRGAGFTNPVLSRSTQQVYTVEPEDFEGFDYGILANNINCIFCHLHVDSVDRYANMDPDNYGTYDRVKIGSLESLHLRVDADGNTGLPNDGDADSWVAGTIYTRGTATDQAGNPIPNWSDITLGSFAFDSSGKIVEDGWGELTPKMLVPAPDASSVLENLYLNYPVDYGLMADGKLPPTFPPPIPDDGGYDPALGGPVPGAAGNKVLDDAEFYKTATGAEGAITAGIITQVPAGYVINDLNTYTFAISQGNSSSINKTVTGNVVLTGTAANPITIDGTVAIDGDLVITGYVKGQGSLIVKGNVYVPSNLQYLDGQAYAEGDAPGAPTGPPTFGLAQDGTQNALGIAAGGNVLIGDYQKPSYTLPDGSWQTVGPFDFVTGEPGGGWSFALAEVALFNQGEWSKTQPKLPGPGEDNSDPSTWTVVNQSYKGPSYIPRYYSYGEGGTIPIFNQGPSFFNAGTQSWMVSDYSKEIPKGWNDPSIGYELLTEIDPNDPFDPNAGYLTNAVVSHIAPTGGWIDPNLYQVIVAAYQATQPLGEPLHLDGLIYTNNAIFGIVSRFSMMQGRMLVNGALVAADLGLLVPSSLNGAGYGTSANTPGTMFGVGLRLNYDRRVRNMLNVTNPNQVQIKRTLWQPSSNVLASY